MATSIYKQSKVIFSIAGIPVTDIAEDGEITVEYDRDRVTKQNDINTGGIFSVRNGKPAKITVPIMRNSRWHTIISNYKNIDKMVAVSLADRNDYGSNKTYVSTHAMIQDAPDTFGADASSVGYVFEIVHLMDITAPEL